MHTDLFEANTPGDVSCDQQLTCLVSLLKICDFMGLPFCFFVLKYEVPIVLPDTHKCYYVQFDFYDEFLS